MSVNEKNQSSDCKEENFVKQYKEKHLLEQLQEYGRSDFYPLHMPGHKRRIGSLKELYSIDITEIDGFDNLSHAEGILLEAQKRAARLYGTQETYYLVNGSTCGILAAVSALVKRGDHILMARNCHKAAYHAVFLNGLRVTYLYPETDWKRGLNSALRPEQVRAALKENPDIKAVLITSPTYDGVVSDIRQIAEEVHRAGAVLIVDEAHGAHFGMHPYFPESARSCGADLVINSLHKTLPSPTQTALLHVCTKRIDRERLRRYLGIYQSSSPSYVLMAGIDECVRLLEQDGAALFDRFAKRLTQMRIQLGQMRDLHLVNGREDDLYAFDFDRSKVLISTERSTLTGPELANRLRNEYHMEPEMSAEQYVTAIFTIADTEEGFDRLEKALLEIDRQETQRCGMQMPEQSAAERPVIPKEIIWQPNEEALSIEEAESRPHEKIAVDEAPGKISGEYVYLYPPGIPLLVPGERIPEQLPGWLHHFRQLGLNIQGLDDYSASTIKTVQE
jgi:arginine/lysine/ornithine decarboxylase